MTSNSSSFLSLKDIIKSYGELFVLKHLNADIEKGELVTFLGPSGCGKSTLLRCIAGFTKMNSGTIILGGRVINDDPPHKRGTGMVFQNYALFPHLSVENNIGFGLKVLKYPKREIKKRVEELLELVKLRGLGSRRIDQLSGGQQQRVALARALSLEPKILLLDEPLSNLDANLRVTMRAEIRRLQKEMGLTVIFVTHDQEEAMSISDRLMIIYEGKVEQVGSSTDIYDRPANEFIAGFIGYVNFVEGKIQTIDNERDFIRVESDVGAIEILAKGKDLKVGEVIKLVIRPENITMVVSDETERNNLLFGEITNSIYTGSLVKYFINVGKHMFIMEQHTPKKYGILKIHQKIAIELSRDLHILQKRG